MSKRKQNPECILILQDVGKNMNELYNTEETYLKLSKNCVQQIMLRKLFSESLDEFGLITFGSETTNNKLANDKAYCGIDVKTEHFSYINRDILKQVDNLECNSNGSGDWLDALVVATKFICDESEVKPYSELKIVLLSNFNNVVNDDKVDIITKKLKNMSIDLTVIGPEIDANISSENLTAETLGESKVLISSLVDELQGTLCSFKDAYTELENLQRKSAKPTPWNSMLVISSKIKIPIRAFKKISKPKAYKWTLGTIDDETAGVQKEKAYMKFDEANETEVEVQRDELIDAYLFGTTIVPFSDIDKDSMQYKSGPKGLYLVGCTSRDSVPQNILMGEGSYVILSKLDDQIGNRALQAFLQAMHENDIVGIARRVYVDNSSAYLGVLYPCVTDESRYLVFVQLPYAEDEHIYKFPSLNKTEFTSDDEAKTVIDDLITAMDLDEIDEDNELYDINRTHDPHEQYMLRCIGHKYVYSDEPIPEQIKSDMIRAMQQKPVIVERSKETLTEIKRKFQLEKVVKKNIKKFRRRNFNDEEEKVDLGQALTSKSENDADKTSCEDMLLSVENEIQQNTEEIDKCIEKIKSLREDCCSKDADCYNRWISRMRSIVQEQNLSTFWKAIVDEKLGLITVLESKLSDIDEDTNKQFWDVEFKEEEQDSMYGSIDGSNNDDWLDDL